ncbi:chorismate mutase [Curvibacter sp. CHRR-16]|uniref:chorismate mutase n=1 Tax=Curvibacter sp. CHRR-16 TaxID=2835872 RepID=UPI001BDA34B3|nr:chorismate mutase [Curvibacter sp. CHRR-16]MBT0570596.1 chorismate mutase [Curvibacter sp. CHRR-16]
MSKVQHQYDAARKAKHCDNMQQVREHIDALDTQITALLVERTGYMTEAARIKQDPSKVYDQARIDFILARVRAMAQAQGGQPDVVEAAYKALIHASIEFEHREFARLRQGAQQ